MNLQEIENVQCLFIKLNYIEKIITTELSVIENIQTKDICNKLLISIKKRKLEIINLAKNENFNYVNSYAVNSR